MLEIRKISENFYLIGGEYIANTYSQAVIIANKDTKGKGFVIDYAKVSFWKNLKNKLNFPVALLESWM